MEKLAEALPQLAEDDLLQVVQMVHDNKTEDTYTKNDVESEFFSLFAYLPRQPLWAGRKSFFLLSTLEHDEADHPSKLDGEFHVDLYTLPDQLIKMLWDFCEKKVDLNSLA